MADLAALIERLEALTGPDAETDWLITQWADPGAVRHSSAHQHYTRSLDAVIALVERELPGWCVISNSKDGQGTVLIHKDGAPYADMPRADSGSQARPIAIAHCLALLHVRAKGGDNG